LVLSQRGFQRTTNTYLFGTGGQTLFPLNFSTKESLHKLGLLYVLYHMWSIYLQFNKLLKLRNTCPKLVDMSLKKVTRPGISTFKFRFRLNSAMDVGAIQLVVIQGVHFLAGSLVFDHEVP